MDRKNISCLTEEPFRQLENLISLVIVSGRACEPVGLFNSKMGIVIFLFHYAEQTRDASFADIAYELMDEIQDGIDAHFLSNYANGLAGIGAGIEYLADFGDTPPPFR